MISLRLIPPGDIDAILLVLPKDGAFDGIDPKSGSFNGTDPNFPKKKKDDRVVVQSDIQ
jgi:hypothetical protein